MGTKSQSRAYLFASFVVLFWGTSATAFKIGLKHIEPIQLLFWSSFSASIILFSILLFQNKLELIQFRSKSDFALSMAEALLNPFLYYLVLFKAYNLLPTQVAQPLNYIWPIVLVVLSAIILKHPLHLTDITALLISLTGVAFISSQGNPNIFAKTNPKGVLLAIGSSIIWAGFWIVNMYDKHRDVVAKLFISFSMATFFTLIYMLLTDNSPVFNLNGFATSVYIGAFEMGITFVLWLKALNSATNTARLGNFSYLVPFIALLFISIVLKEKIVWTTLLGLSLIIGAIIFQQVFAKRTVKNSDS